MPVYRDEGVVLRTFKLGEADRIVELLTRGHGKVRAVVRGVRRTKSRFGARLEPFMRDDLLIVTGRSLDVVSQAETIGAYAEPICADYDAYGAGNVILETVDRLVTVEGEPAREQYRLLIAALGSLARGEHASEAIALSYVLRAMALAGWRPRLDACVGCGRHDGLGWLSFSAGGASCASHRSADAQAMGEDSRQALQALLVGDWARLDGRDLPSDVHGLVRAWAEYYLERPIRSLRL